MSDKKADPSLEGRMRDMILGNAGGSTAPPTAPQDNQPRQQLPGELSGADTGADGAAKTSRKRLNQAQRRQMSAQLTIPIDPRATVNVGAQRGRPAGQDFPQQQHSNRPYQPHQPQQQSYHPHQQQQPYGRYGQQQQQQQPRGGYQHRGAQRPQSAGYQQASFSTQGPQRSAGFNAPSPYGQPLPSPYGSGPSPGFPPQGNNNWRSGQGRGSGQESARGGRQAYNPRQSQVAPENIQAQVALLEQLCGAVIPKIEIEFTEIREKEAFRMRIDEICRKVVVDHERSFNGIWDFPPQSVQLRSFGSLASGFATKAADLDLGLLSPLSPLQLDSQDSPIPRLVEKAFLNAGLGARLLTKTRVPIIKLCEKPGDKLRQDLLGARDRWEKGLDPEQEEDTADIHQEGAEASTKDSHDLHDPHDRKNVSTSIRGGDGGDDEDASATPEQMLAKFRQPQGQSLTNYEAAAKKLLRKLGGRDITLSTVDDFTLHDYRVLTDVCHAFVRGLRDKNLRDRLLSVVSLSAISDPSMPKWRSLAGVFIQVEGESLVRLWEARQVTEKDEVHERQAAAKVDMWNAVQNKASFGLDLLGYNKELQSTLELLKKIPSLQIINLAQGGFESAKAYHASAERALNDLGGLDRIMPQNPILKVVIEHYIQGIKNQEWRDQVKKDAADMKSEITLKSVARRHKALQLASEYEKALNKNLYPREHVEDVQAYISILRSPLVRTMTGPGQVQFIVPIPAEENHILSIMKNLADPAKLAPNQPRDPYRDSLEFPKSGVGVQCDINFSAHLALQNTHLLRCYAATDRRVKPMVLFIKHWAKVRRINTAYRGTLSSYGYVLMVLHYLVNVAQPFICPNLQQLAPPAPQGLLPAQFEETVECKGHNIQFWRDLPEIQRLAAEGTLNHNQDSIGVLLRGFFEYYANSYYIPAIKGRGFDWGRDVLSLRTPGGLRTKQEKGWTGAKTTIVQLSGQAPTSGDLTSPTGAVAPSPGFGPGWTSGHSQASTLPLPVQVKPAETKEIRHRYLFAIEDPFELDHNVARTVTHNGIVAIRDEFRRAWRIIKSVGLVTRDEDLLADAVEEAKKNERAPFRALLAEIHGLEGDA